MNTSLEQIQNFLPIYDGLATAGQPLQDQFALIAEAGYRVVINLATATSWDAVANEAEIVNSVGMEYHTIPVLWEAPRLENLRSFCDLMDSLQGRQVFVHCARNMRVSAFVFLYRVKRLGHNLDACRTTMQLIWQPQGDVWEELINNALEVVI